MKKSRFTEAQIAFALPQSEGPLHRHLRGFDIDPQPGRSIYVKGGTDSELNGADHYAARMQILILDFK